MEVNENEHKDEKSCEDEDEANWREKYELAETQLSRVRQQTAKVRELLNIKVYIPAYFFFNILRQVL